MSCARYFNRDVDPKTLDMDQRFFDREDTYKNHEAAARAFYKWVAKNQMYYPLRWCLQYRWNNREVWDWERMPVRGFTTYHYGTGLGRLGMPAFRNWRSCAWDAWNGEFLRHREKWEEAVRAKREAKWEARNEGWKRRHLHSSMGMKVLKFLAAGAALRDEN